MHIFVGSTNPVKLNAVIAASSEQWPEVKVLGFEVASGVSDQPWGDEETKLGAENRARAALAAGMKTTFDTTSRSRTSATSNASDQSAQLLKKSDPPVTMSDEIIGIGMEGGVFEEKDGELWNTVWTCVVDPSGKAVFANGERFHLPESLSRLIRAGKEMGPAMDELIGTTNIKHQGGMIGAITLNFIDRTEMYTGLAKLAVGLWFGRDWEKKLSGS